MARLAHYVMASEWRAALIASLLLFLPLFSWAGASVVALYALRRGIEKSLLVTAAPMLSASLMAFGFGTVPAVFLGGIATFAVVGIWMKIFPQE